MRRGLWYAAAAYGIWGLLPLYWHALDQVPALELISHRIVWSCVLLAVVIGVSRQFGAFRRDIASPRVLFIYALAALLIGVNWFTYIWAVNAGFVIETALGYFINPLISVLLGVVILKERLRPVQWIAVAVAGSGVAYLTWSYGSLPWIALTLAVTFAFYGLVKKLAPLGSAQGLLLETAILLIPAFAVIVIAESAAGPGTLEQAGAGTWLLLVGSGIATTVPLLLFASATRLIPLLWIGIMQYLAPTIGFLLGVFVFHEPMTPQRLVGFVLVWIALAIFGTEGVLAHRAQTVPATTD